MANENNLNDPIADINEPNTSQQNLNNEALDDVQSVPSSAVAVVNARK